VLRVAITGAAGQLGRELVRAFTDAGDEVLAPARHFDIRDPASLVALEAWRPTVVVNSAAYTDVDGCARDPGLAMAVNGDGATAVARAAAAVDALIVQISTNEVFDGTLDRPYTEDDTPNPINPYGLSKLAGERGVVAANARHLIVRTAWLFGPGSANFVTKIRGAARRSLEAGGALRVVDDEWGNPTPTPWLAETIAWLVREPRAHRPMVVHVAGAPAVTRRGWATECVRGLDVEIDPIASSEYQRVSRPPLRAVLDTRLLAKLGRASADWHEMTRALAAAEL
jgi:dTDP-4-dehydrorhamnose reductase